MLSCARQTWETPQSEAAAAMLMFEETSVAAPRRGWTFVEHVSMIPRQEMNLWQTKETQNRSKQNLSRREKSLIWSDCIDLAKRCADVWRKRVCQCKFVQTSRAACAMHNIISDKFWAKVKVYYMLLACEWEPGDLTRHFEKLSVLLVFIQNKMWDILRFMYHRNVCDKIRRN